MELHFHGGRGDLLMALDTAGNVVTEMTYGPWGEVVRVDGTGGAAGMTKHRRRFNGKEHDAASGLVYYGFRYWDPQSLLWTQGDPLYRFKPDKARYEARRQSLYTFSLNNAVRFVDPDGLDAAEDAKKKINAYKSKILKDGLEAHFLIGQHYRQKHPEAAGHIYLNVMPLKTIIRNVKGPEKVPGTLTEEQLNSKPDIYNALTGHLYEIKSSFGFSVSLMDMNWYLNILASIDMLAVRGPSDDPGVSGVLPASDGRWLFFYSPVPGSILYMYTKRIPGFENLPVQDIVPAPVKEPARQERRQELPGWRLMPSPGSLPIFIGPEGWLRRGSGSA
jgi:RHS repeat-associated protein